MKLSSAMSRVAMCFGLVVQPALALSFGQAKDIASWSPDDLDELFKSPNASNAIGFSGWDVSKSPSQGTSKGSRPAKADWKLSLEVAADLPAKTKKNMLFTATRIQVELPDSIEKVADDWLQCTTFIFSVKLDGDGDIKPDCSGVVSDKCRKSLSEQVMKGGCSAIDQTLCDGEGYNTVNNGMIGMSQYGPLLKNNTAQIVLESTDGDEGTYDAGDTSRYDEAIRLVHVVAFGLARTNQTEEEDPERVGMDPNSELPGNLQCIRAQTFAEGSRTFSRADGAAKISLFATGVGTMAAFCMMMLF